MQKVLITPATLAGVEAPFLKLLRDARFEIVFPPVRRQLTDEEIIQLLPGITACLAGSEPYTRRAIEGAPQLRVIARCGVGYDAVDLAAANERGIPVTITPGANQDAVAEHTMALMLALTRTLISQHNGIVAGKWPRESSVPVRGHTLGIAGLGRIGKAVAVRAAAFDMRLVAFEPAPDMNFVKQYKIELLPFEKLLAVSDFVSIHVPLSVESKHLINSRTLALMKPTAYLLNTARGGLVCEADLYKALKEKKIAGAGLDVFEEEPPDPNNPLFKLDNVVLTAHTAGSDWKSRNDMAYMAAQAIVALSRGEWPAHQVVNPESRAKHRW